MKLVIRVPRALLAGRTRPRRGTANDGAGIQLSPLRRHMGRLRVDTLLTGRRFVAPATQSLFDALYPDGDGDGGGGGEAPVRRAQMSGELMRWITDSDEGKLLFAADRTAADDDVIVAAVLSCLGEPGMDRHVRLMLARALGLTKRHKDVLFYAALAAPDRHAFVQVMCSTLYRDCLRDKEYDSVLAWLAGQLARALARNCLASAAHIGDLAETMKRVVSAAAVAAQPV